MIVVIGGGAAGIAAARTLWDANADVLLVEAGGRLGGRAHTLLLPASMGPVAPGAVPRRRPGPSRHGGSKDALSLDHERSATGPRPSPGNAVAPSDTLLTVDAGCGWLHSAGRNPWTDLAECYGFTVDRTPTNWTTQWRDLGFPPEEQRSFREAWQRWEETAQAALGGADRPLSDFIAPDDRWRPMIDAISGYANGAPLSEVSLHDWAAYEDAATEDNWVIAQGYGTVVARHALGVPVQLNTIVWRVDHHARTLRLHTERGTIEAEQVIVCVPTTALASEALLFDPPLPAKHDAAAALPLGLADKVFLHVAGGGLPENGHLIGNPYSGKTASHRLSPFGWPLIESFFGGDCAEALEQEGDGAAADFAIGEMVALLGSDWRRRLTPLAATRWRAEPHIHGAYSHARIGAAAQRSALAEPVNERLFFAGEACSGQDFSTAHGAYATGVAAARAVLAQRALAPI
jgi:monoamine oxidase